MQIAAKLNEYFTNSLVGARIGSRQPLSSPGHRLRPFRSLSEGEAGGAFLPTAFLASKPTPRSPERAFKRTCTGSFTMFNEPDEHQEIQDAVR